MRKSFAFLIVLTIFFISACATSGGGAGLSLAEAVDASAETIAARLPARSRVVVAAFTSPGAGLSEYLAKELSLALVNNGVEAADLRTLEYVYRGLEINPSAGLTDESARIVGKFLGALLVISGELSELDGAYRYRVNAVRTETGIRESAADFDLQSGRATKRRIDALTEQLGVTQNTNNVNEGKTPQTAGAFIDRGILFAGQGGYEKAIADFSEAVKIDPRASAAYTLRGMALFAGVSKTNSTDGEARVFEDAVSDYIEAIRLDPANVINYIERGTAYAGRGETDRAIADFDRALALAPGYASVYNKRGAAYAGKGDYDSAIADFEMTLRIDPNHDGAKNNIEKIIQKEQNGE